MALKVNNPNLINMVPLENGTPKATTNQPADKLTSKSDNVTVTTGSNLLTGITLSDAKLSVNQDGKWIKVSQMKAGVEIATIDGWEEVIFIKRLGREQVYDIEVEGTHNFVGNDIVAHNTYITGNVGIGAAFTTSGIVTPVNGLAVQGNVGIGTTSPTNPLTVIGNANITGTLTTAGLTNTGTFLAANGSASAPSYSFSNLTNAGLWTNGDGLLLTTGGSNTSGITVTGAGNVGIGTTSPVYALDVLSSSASEGLQLSGPSPLIYLNENDQAANDKLWSLWVSGSTLYGKSVNDAKSSSANWLQVTRGSGATISTVSFPNGNIGIGTTTPVGKLDITDTSNTAASLSLANNTATTIGNGANTLGVLDLQSTTLTTGNFLNMEVNALTSGKGLNLTSTSTGLTGDLANITASGSNAAVTGSVLKVGLTGSSSIGTALNVTTAGSSGFALRVNDDGTYTDTSPFVVDYAGNVGIGTTGPGSPLTIVSPYTSATGSTNAIFSLSGYNNANSDFVGGVSFTPTVGTLGTSGLNITGVSVSPTFNAVNSSTIASARSLYVTGAKTGAQTITNAYALYVDAQTGATNNYAAVFNNGNVGIGTTAPVGKLDITDTSNTAASLSLTNNTATTIGNGANTLGVLDLQSTTLTTGNFLNMEVNALTSGKGLNLTSTSTGLTGDLANITASGSNAAVTGSVLKVGLTGSSSIGTALNVTTAGSSGFALRVNDDGTYTDASSFVVDYTGNVGIGTTSPADNLHVYDASGNSRIRVETAAAAGYSILDFKTPNYLREFNLNNSNGLFSFYDQTVGQYRWVIDNSGNVGIGFTSPNQALQVASAPSAATSLANILGANGSQLSLTGSTASTLMEKLAIGVDTTNNFGYLQAGNSSSATAYNLILEPNGGNIGIGTTSPGSKLNIATADSSIMVGTGTAPSVVPALDVVNSSGYGLIMSNVITDATGKISSLGIRHYTNTEEPLIVIRGSAGQTSNAVTIGGGSSLWNAATQIDFYTAANTTTVTGTSRMTIDTAGNVGIGTTGPVALLDIAGSGGATDFRISRAGNPSAYLSISSQGGSYNSSNFTIAGTNTLTLNNGGIAVGTYSGGSIQVPSNGLIVSGNVGIGTTSPSTKLAVSGAGTFGYGGASSFAVSSGTSLATSGNLGVGTTSPLGNLHVVGQCVTGDTILRRKRKKLKTQNSKLKTGGKDPNPEDKYEEVEIKDIKEGDEILTLDERTGEFVASKVKALKGMGTKDIFELTTSSGKTIRTTGNHPYLAITKDDIIKQSSGEGHIGPAASNIAEVGGEFRSIFHPGSSVADGSVLHSAVFIDYANIKAWAREKGLSFDMELLYSSLKTAGVDKILLYYGTDSKNPLSYSFLNKMRSIGFEVITKDVKYFKVSLLNLLKQRINQELLKKLSPKTRQALLSEVEELERKHIRLLSPKANFDVEIALDIILLSQKYQAFILFSGDSDFLPIIKYLRGQGKTVIVSAGKKYMAGDLIKATDKFLFLETLDQKVKGLLKKPSPAKRDWKKSDLNIPKILPFVKGGKWTKVTQLKTGQYIATLSKDSQPSYEKITSIKKVKREQVFDIEVEGTHNFVGNGIVAHNTYITGNVGIGAAFTTSGIVTPTNGLAVQGNVGIGTTSPTNPLTVIGNANITGTLTTAGLTNTGTFLAANGSASAPSYSFSNLTNAGLWTNGDGLLLTTGGSNTSGITVTAAGNVGIGTTVPVAQLDVAGSVQITKYLYLKDFDNGGGVTSSIISRDSNTMFWSNGVIIGQYSDGSNSALGEGILKVKNSAYLAATSGNVGIGTTGPTTNLAVASAGTFNWGGNKSYAVSSGTGLAVSGNVGIGTTSPANVLSVIAGSAGVPPITAYGTNGILNARMGSWSSDNGALEISNSAGASKILLFSNGSSYINGGNVGIGFTSPNAALQVASAPSAATSLANILGANGSQLSLTGSTASTLMEKLAIGIDTTNNFGYLQAGNSSSATAYNLILEPNGGNVGIGITSPGQLLEVSKSNANDAIIKVSTTGTGAGAYFEANSALSGYIGLRLRNGTTDKWFIGDYETGKLSFTVGTPSNTPKMVMDTNGNIGIGTVSPVADFHLVGDAASTAVNLMTQASTGAFGLAVLDNGNVGVGTTNPTATLQVGGGGTVYIENELYLATSTDPADPNYTFWSDQDTGLYNPAADTLGITTNGIQRVWVNSAGKVGIGTTSPESLLHLQDGSAGSVTSVTTTGLTIESKDDAQIQLLTPNINTGNIFFGDVDDADRAVFGYNHGRDEFRFMNAGGASSLMVIEQAGNVGIGTTGPSTSLAVSGAGTFGYGGASSFAVSAGTGLAVSGNVGVGTTTPNDSLDVQGGNIRNSALAGVGNRAVYSDESGVLTNSASDIRLKTNIEGIPENIDVLAALDKLRGVYFNWDQNNPDAVHFGPQRELGMIAQEVETVLPELVGTNADGYKSLNYSQMTGFLVEVGKAQQKELSAIRYQISDLNNTVASQSAVIARLGEAISVSADGNVGIGTTNPAATLDVIGNTNITGVFSVRNSQGENIFQIDASGSAKLAGTITTQAGAFDVAEDYNTADDSIEAGDVVAVSPSFGGSVINNSQSQNNQSTGNNKEDPISQTDVNHNLPFLANASDKYQTASDNTSSNVNTSALPASNGGKNIPATNTANNTSPIATQIEDKALNSERESLISSSVPAVVSKVEPPVVSKVEPPVVSKVEPSIEKSTKPYQGSVLGIISTKPGIKLSGSSRLANAPSNKNTLSSSTESSSGEATSLSSSTESSSGEATLRSVALSGRVPVKVSTENGPIETGDFLTSSSTPGVAMKALRPGQMIGKALESFPTTDYRLPQDSSAEDGRQKTEDDFAYGKILAFVQVSFADPGNFFASFSMDEEGNLIIPKLKAGTIALDPSIASASASLVADSSRLSFDYAQDRSNNNTLSSSTESSSGEVTSLSSSTESSSGEVTSVYYDLTGKIASLEDRINSLEQKLSDYQLLTTAIAEDGRRKTEDSLAVLTEATASASLSTSEESPASPPSEVSTASAQIATSSAQTASVSSPGVSPGSPGVDELNLTPPSVLLATQSAQLVDLKVFSDATISGRLVGYDLSVQNSLKSFGTTALGSTLIAGDLTVDGTMSVTGSSINAISLSDKTDRTDKTDQTYRTDGTLFLQNSPLAQSLDILNGQFTFGKDGTLTVSGTVLASQFAVKSGTSAGAGTILAGQTDLIVENPYVEENSVILITPHTPLAQTLAVADKVKGGFLVKLVHPEATDLSFDYLIVGVVR